MMDRRIPSKPLNRGLDAAWDVGVGFAKRLVPKRQILLKRVDNILRWEKEYSKMSNSKLRETGVEFRAIFRRNRENSVDIAKAFAMVREVAYRQIGEKPFPVQIVGALALEYGLVAEMATGEGKTLTATMATTVAGWRGKGCHVITVNDYLAKRDADWMGKIYRFCGLTVASIDQQTPPDERRIAYAADITYCTNKEVTADFLRDRLVLQHFSGLSSALVARIAGTDRHSTDRVVQRGLNCAVVDEADSILVDEAVTPLIISGDAPNPEQEESFQQAADIASQFVANTDYHVDQRYREIKLTDEGRSRLGKLTKHLKGVWQGKRRCAELVVQALVAKELYFRDKHYVIDDGKVVIVDEFTGRLMPDRSWRDGMHQAVEAKENVKVNAPKDTYARISFQRFFRMYDKLSGMTGTAVEARDEFWQIYHRPVVVVPTNRPCIRKQLPNIILPGNDLKWKVIVDHIRQIHQTARPILIGTRSVKSSEHLSELLKAEQLSHQVLNAINHRQEAQIVAQAGKPGMIMVATNMAGRGTDIKLGHSVAKSGGLHVISSEPNESARIDRQLFGRCARQGDPGSSQAIVSLEDEFVSRYSKNIVKHLIKKYEGVETDISSPFIRGLFRLSQIRAERMALRQRKGVLRTDHWLDEQLGFAGTE